VEQLAKAFAVFPTKAAVKRLIDLTAVKHAREVRAAAHTTLVSLFKTGAQIKFGSAMRNHWLEWWQDHHRTVRLR
jgi:HEAT repeat protein